VPRGWSRDDGGAGHHPLLALQRLASPPGPTTSIAAYGAPGRDRSLVWRTPGREHVPSEIRVAIRKRFGVATTLAFGGAALHATGQLHVGGAPTAILLDLTADEPAANGVTADLDRGRRGTGGPAHGAAAAGAARPPRPRRRCRRCGGPGGAAASPCSTRAAEPPRGTPQERREHPPLTHPGRSSANARRKLPPRIFATCGSVMPIRGDRPHGAVQSAIQHSWHVEMSEEEAAERAAAVGGRAGHSPTGVPG
jgi:hypothetical protein